jgi:DNA-binding Lrp family transcriptional regulator
MSQEQQEEVPRSGAFVLLNVNMGRDDEVLARLREIKGVKEAYQVYGAYDTIARIESENTEKVRQILQERIHKLDNVRDTLTLMEV